MVAEGRGQRAEGGKRRRCAVHPLPTALCPRPGDSHLNEIERLFHTYHEPLVRYLVRRLGDRDWAEEIAQETFVRALRQEQIVSERAWLFAVATNLVRDEARKDARRRRHLELLREQARAEEAVDPEPTSLERAQEAAMARRALECLSERDREALLMREEGLDYGEIAAALELSVGSVGTTLARARRRLVEAMDELTQQQRRREKVSARGNHAS
ncbi:MAG TPA: sigma-70 family RNA polymerase sigma factor [Casimicrobiaceae bacterium]|nr:sigma-70 family RNA polymerase sigma factor [Casimicrobiaceae bacterium]